jgi:hypothetical protein
MGKFGNKFFKNFTFIDLLHRSLYSRRVLCNLADSKEHNNCVPINLDFNNDVKLLFFDFSIGHFYL